MNLAILITICNTCDHLNDSITLGNLPFPSRSKRSKMTDEETNQLMPNWQAKISLVRYSNTQPCYLDTFCTCAIFLL